MSSGKEFQSVNALLKDLSRPQFVLDLTDLIVSFGASVMAMIVSDSGNRTVSFIIINKSMHKETPLH